PFVVANLAPHPDHRMAAADHRAQRDLVPLHQMVDARAANADAPAEIAPVTAPVGLAEHDDIARGRRHIAGEGAEQRGFAGAVGAQDDPVFALRHGPIDAVENRRVTLDVKAVDGDDRWPLAGAARDRGGRGTGGRGRFSWLFFHGALSDASQAMTPCRARKSSIERIHSAGRSIWRKWVVSAIAS